jgi:hypothetical protein
MVPNTAIFGVNVAAETVSAYALRVTLIAFALTATTLNARGFAEEKLNSGDASGRRHVDHVRPHVYDVTRNREAG